MEKPLTPMSVQDIENGLELLGLKIEERTEPWQGACGIYHSMLTESIIKFQSEMIMETFPANGPVLTKIIGKDTKEKMEAAARVKDDMNDQLTDKMPEFRPEHERMLWNLGFSGAAFKKVYYDPALGRQVDHEDPPVAFDPRPFHKTFGFHFIKKQRDIGAA